MGQFIAVIIILIIAKLIVDMVKDQLNRGKATPKAVRSSISVIPGWIPAACLTKRKPR
jgi:hypothetical protein